MLEFYLSLIEDHGYDDKLIEIYEGYKPWMLRTAYSFLHDDDLSQDAVHDVFMNIIKRIRNIPDETIDLTKSYLFIAIKHACIDILNKRKKNFVFDLDSQFSPQNSTINHLLLSYPIFFEPLPYTKALYHPVVE